MQQAEGKPPIIRAAPCKLLDAKPRPERLVKRAAVWRKPHKLPAWMPAKGFAQIHGISGFERPGQNRRVAEQVVKFQKDEFADGNVIAVLERLEKSRGP